MSFEQFCERVPARLEGRQITWQLNGNAATGTITNAQVEGRGVLLTIDSITYDTSGLVGPASHELRLCENAQYSIRGAEDEKSNGFERRAIIIRDAAGTNGGKITIHQAVTEPA